jgi:glycosyltransferase involved in cell wall biosynthesis
MTSDQSSATTGLAICIPTYNRAEILRATLAHLAENHDLFEEIVICDNASPDHTPAVAEEMRGSFSQFRYIRHSTNIGGPRNYNAALSQSRCQYQYLLSDDDRLVPAGVRAALRQLNDHPEAVAVYGGYEAMDDAGSVLLNPHVTEPVCYTSADRFLMAQRHLLLWHPIMRTEAYQRYCFYDDQTWGYWRLIDQLLAVGSIWVLPEHFYCHIPTPGRLESAAVQPWFQEFHRSDWELYLSRLAVTPEHGPLIAQLVTARLDSVMGNAQTWAKKLGLPLVERNFILRRRAYGNRVPETEQEWERRALMAAALARAVEQLTATGSARVFIQSGAMTLPTLISSFETALPSVAFHSASREEMVDHAAEPHDGLIAEDWSVFDDRRSAGVTDEGICRLSWADILATLRLTDDKGVRMLRGPDGTTHMLRF